MAGIVNTKTGQIEGVEEGTLAYYHEIGHLEYSKLPMAMRLDLLQERFIVMCLVLGFTAIIINSIFIAFLGLIIILGYLFIELYEEIWCWKYAKKRMENI